MRARHFPSGKNSIVSGLNSAWDLEKKKISTIIFGPFSSYLIRIFFLSYSKLAFILLMIIRLFNLIFYFYLFLSLIIMLLIFVLFFFKHSFIHSACVFCLLFSSLSMISRVIARITLGFPPLLPPPDLPLPEAGNTKAHILFFIDKIVYSNF